jgi:hypothetical protein
MEEFVSLGSWWLPQNPEKKIPGKLIFSPEDGVKVELYGNFYDRESSIRKTGKFINADDIPLELLERSYGENDESPKKYESIEFIDPEESIILGALENDQKVTLLNCFGSFLGKPDLFFHAEYILKNHHFNSEQDISFHYISVRYSYLEQWTARSGIKVLRSSENPNKWIFLYEPPDNVSVGSFGEFDLEIHFPKSPIDEIKIPLCYKANIEQKAYLRIHGKGHGSLGKYVEAALIFREFLSFATGKIISIKQIFGEIEILRENPWAKETRPQPIQIPMFFGLRNNTKNLETELPANRMLFSLREAENSLEKTFYAWVKKKEEINLIFELFMITLYTPKLYLRYKFSNMFQAIEVYYETRLNKTSRRASIAKKVESVISSMSSSLPDEFIGGKDNKKLFSERVAYTRNALVHNQKSMLAKAAKGEELWQLFCSLQILLKACILKELDFDSGYIRERMLKDGNQTSGWKPSD